MIQCSVCKSAPAVATLIEESVGDRSFCAVCLAQFDAEASELAERIAEERKRLSN
jgi:hypothetical protein